MDRIRAGELDRRITLETATEIVNDAYERETVWTTALSQVPAKKVYLSGGEQYEDFEKNTEIKQKYLIRFRDDVTKRMRIKDGSDYFEIESIEEVGRRVGLYLYAVGWPNRE